MSDNGDNNGLPDSVTFHYIKSPQFREIFAEGMFGGVTPRGYISVALYKERFPIPISITNAFDEQGILNDEVKRNGKEGVVRLVEANVYFDRAAAASLVEWLQEKIKELDTLRAQAEAKGVAN